MISCRCVCLCLYSVHVQIHVCKPLTEEGPRIVLMEQKSRVSLDENVNRTFVAQKNGVTSTRIQLYIHVHVYVHVDYSEFDIPK